MCNQGYPGIESCLGGLLGELSAQTLINQNKRLAMLGREGRKNLVFVVSTGIDPALLSPCGVALHLENDLVIEEMLEADLTTNAGVGIKQGEGRPARHGA